MCTSKQRPADDDLRIRSAAAPILAGSVSFPAPTLAPSAMSPSSIRAQRWRWRARSRKSRTGEKTTTRSIGRTLGLPRWRRHSLPRHRQLGAMPWFTLWRRCHGVRVRHPNLPVMRASDRHLLAMKAAAVRRKTRDLQDAQSTRLNGGAFLIYKADVQTATRKLNRTVVHQTLDTRLSVPELCRHL
jgi:hypothetical protein